MQIFQHEFVNLIWLRERGYGGEDISRAKQTYILLRVIMDNPVFVALTKGLRKTNAVIVHITTEPKLRRAFH